MPAAPRSVGINRGNPSHGGLLLLTVPLTFLVLLLEVRTARAFALLQRTAFRTTATREHVDREATTTLRRHCRSASWSTLEMAGGAAAGRIRVGSTGWSSWCSTSTGSSSSSRSTTSNDSSVRGTALSMAGGNEENRSVEEEWPFHKSRYVSVSYTHLTLPTIYSV